MIHVIFSKKTKNYISLRRIIWTWEALIHFGMISEVKDMKSHVLWATGKTPNKKKLSSFILNSILKIFKKK